MGWENYYANTDGIIYMVDSADERRFDECAEELETLLKADQLLDVPVLVLANKSDLMGAKPAAEVMEALELTDNASRWVHVQGCSAKTGENLEAGLTLLITQVSKRKSQEWARQMRSRRQRR